MQCMACSASGEWNPLQQKTTGKARPVLQCIDPLNPTGHCATLFNIVSVKLTARSVNGQNARQNWRAVYGSL